MVANKLPPRSRVVSAFHTISEIKLKNLSQTLDSDTFICGDDQNAIAKLRGLIEEISGLRPGLPWATCTSLSSRNPNSNVPKCFQTK